MSTVKFEVYIDRNFVEEVDKQRLAFDNNQDLQDFYRFITKLQGVDIITNYESVDEFEKVVETSPFWLKLYDGSVSPMLSPDFCQQLEEQEFYTGSTGFKLFFVERNDVKDLSDKFGLLYINSSNLLVTWQFFSDERDDLSLPITDNSDCNPRFENWNYLRNFSHPLNSIILCDRYVLQNEQQFENNIFDLIKCLKCYKLPKLNILIVSELMGSEYKGNTKVTIHNDIDKYANLIEDRLIKQQKIQSLDLKIIKLTNSKEKNFYREHDRSLITNYWYINPQNSFNFFNESIQKKLEVRSNIDFRFVFRKSVRNLLKERLSIINDIVNHTTDLPEMKKVYNNGAIKSRLLPV